MKHLKYFESFEEDIESEGEDIKYHMMLIKDIFQDVIDDYHIEYSLNNELDYIDGLYYYISYDKNNNYIEFDISYIEDETYAGSLDILKMDLSGHIKRLENIGYDVSKYDRKAVEGCNITIRIKLPEELNESVSDSDYHIQAVKDVFQELFDEYDMDLDDGSGSIGRHYLINYSDLYKDRGFTLWLYEINSKRYSSDFLRGVDLSPYYKRLENMGYKVDVRFSPSWIEITISF